MHRENERHCLLGDILISNASQIRILTDDSISMKKQSRLAYHPQVRIKVDFHNTIRNGLLVLFFRGSRPAVEYKIYWLIALGASLLLDESLVLL